MSIQDWGAVGEMVGAVAVVATLLYLTAQIRMSARQMRGQAILEINRMTKTILDAGRDDPELADLVIRGSLDWDALSDREKTRAHMWFLSELQLYETMFELVEQKAIAPAAYDVREEYLVRFMNTVGRRKWLDEHSYFLNRGFVTRLEARLREKGPASNDEWLSLLPFLDRDLDASGGRGEVRS